MHWSSCQVLLCLLLLKTYPNTSESCWQFFLKLKVPNMFSQPSWHRIPNYLTGLFAWFEPLSLSPWLHWSGCYRNCYLYDSDFLICCFLPFLSFHLDRTELDTSGPQLQCDPVIKCFWRWFQTVAFKCESFLLPATPFYCTVENNGLKLLIFRCIF